jgi:hypothetical protein
MTDELLRMWKGYSQFRPRIYVEGLKATGKKLRMSGVSTTTGTGLLPDT